VLVALSKKKDYTVIAVWVLTNTSVEDIQEPAVLERTTPAVKNPELPYYSVTLQRDSVSGEHSPIV